MSESDRMHEEELRRALKAAADLVMPAGDGLSKIRERIQRTRAYGWLLAGITYPARRLLVGARVAISALTAVVVSHAAATGSHSVLPGGHSAARARLHSAPRRHGAGRRARRRPGWWLRPALAGAAAVVLVAVVSFGLPRLLQETVTPASSNSTAPGGASPGGSGGGHPFGTGRSSGDGSSSQGSGSSQGTSAGRSSAPKVSTSCASKVSTAVAAGPSQTVGPAAQGARGLIGELPLNPGAPRNAVGSSSCSAKSPAPQSSGTGPATPAPTGTLTPTSPPPSESSSPTPTDSQSSSPTPTDSESPTVSPAAGSEASPS